LCPALEARATISIVWAKPLLRGAWRGSAIKYSPLKRQSEAGKCFKGLSKLFLHSKAYTFLLFLSLQRC